MKVAVLTSSRADYSLLYPLLIKLKQDGYFNLNILAFGTHLSKKHGYTVDAIINDGFEVAYYVDTNPTSDKPFSISKAMGMVIKKFSGKWKMEKFDLIISIGDRFEMFAACAASIPFNIPIAHIHGGETTLGAFDDIFRHSITQMSTFHFTAADSYKKRVIELKGSDKNIYCVGALSIDNLVSQKLLSKESFKNKFNIDISIPSILITFQPETIDHTKNREYINVLIDSLSELKNFQLIITMPNADTMGNYIRKKLEQFIVKNENAIKVESFGTIGYLTCMKYCTMLLGNTSSGFIEAAYFPKYVINLGNRQLGRLVTPNIKNVPIEKNEILKAVEEYQNIDLPEYNGVYGTGNAADNIVSIIKLQYNHIYTS